MSTFNAQFRKLHFTFDVPNNGAGLLISVGRPDPTGGAIVGTHSPVTGGDGRVAVAWQFKSPLAEPFGVTISEGTASQGADNFEVLTPGDSTDWPSTKSPEYYRVVGDGGACRVTGWVLTQPA